MKSVIITGAGSGIGRACALRLAADGYRITVNDVRADAGEAVAAEIKAKAELRSPRRATSRVKRMWRPSSAHRALPLGTPPIS
jgi:NAD(P)-dependent dehydrogenase (short-subunit alcohol dehydrogenase family)